jgi:hypothetical protein
MNSAAITRTSSADAASAAKDHAAATEWLIGTTKFGKPIWVKRQKVGTGFDIKVGGGGVKPPMLDSTFTRFEHAKEAVLTYMRSVHYDAPLDPDFTASE